MKLYRATRVVLLLADDLDDEEAVVDAAAAAMRQEEEPPEIDELTPEQVRTLMPEWLDSYPWTTPAASDWPQTTTEAVLAKMQEQEQP